MREILGSLLSLSPLLCSALLLPMAGCARPAALQTSAVPTRPAPHLSIDLSGPEPKPADSDPKANLALDEIEPRPQFPAGPPASQPSSAVPLEAVRLFAQARIAQLDGQRLQASRLLEQAIALDPGSFELHRSLGNLYAAASDARAADEWEKAAAIEPDHLDLQIALGRTAGDAGDAPKALEHLRLALLTSEYHRNDPAAGEADFLLARALQQGGYDRAALQTYERLLARLRGAHFAARTNPQVAGLLARPDTLALHIAALYEKNKAYAPALTLLRTIAARQPGNVDLQARVIRDAAAAGDRDRAIAGATDLVRSSHADARSVSLLADVAGPDAVTALRKLHDANPLDRDVLYALSDLLRGGGHDADAAGVLAEAARRWPDDPRLIRRQAELLRDRNGLADAARLVIAAFARRPDHAIELAPLWDALAQPSPHGAPLRWATVRSFAVNAAEQPARDVLLARLAELQHRDAIERDALARAVEARPAFAPAFREMLALIRADPSRTPGQKAADATALAEGARAAGDAGLAAELRGQALLDDGNAADAATEFAAAVKAGDRAPELCMNFAAALHATGDEQGAQALLWKVVSDRPLAAEAYEELYAIYQKRDETQRARGVLTVWLSADPDSAAAQRLQAVDAFKDRQFTEAERILKRLLETHEADPQVLAAVVQFYAETGRLNVLVPLLRERLAAEPWNSSLAVALFEACERQHQRLAALAVLDDLRASAASARDADLLYTLAGLYGRIDAPEQSERALADVLKLDPSFAGANNDLAYTWAEQGKNLREAEAMIRKALQAEPDNLSFLDSMGWVLYKRGRFGEALRELERAASLTDPVVLDHLGDTLYRLGQQANAAAQWQHAAERLADQQADDRDDLKKLRGALARKQQQLAAGRAVEVAPVVEEK